MVRISTKRTIRPMPLFKPINTDMPTPDEVHDDLKLASDVLNAAPDVIDKISSFMPPEQQGDLIQPVHGNS